MFPLTHWPVLKMGHPGYLPPRFSSCWYKAFDWGNSEGAKSFAVSCPCTWTVSRCFLDEGMRNDPQAASHLRTLSFSSFLAEGGSAHDAEAPQGAKDVHDPDHRSVQVCLPSPHSVPAKLQTHLSPGPSSQKRDPAPSCSQGGTSRQHLSPLQGADGWGRQDTGSLRTGAKVIHKHRVLFYMR